MGSTDSFQGFYLRRVLLHDANEEGGRSSHACSLAFCHVFADFSLVFSLFKALLKLRGVEIEALGMAQEICDLQCIDIGKEEVVHFPVLSLFACTPACLSGLERFFMNRFEREIEEEIFHPAC